MKRLSLISIVRLVCNEIDSSRFDDKRKRSIFICSVLASTIDRDRKYGSERFEYERRKRAIAPYVSSLDRCND